MNDKELLKAKAKAAARSARLSSGAYLIDEKTHEIFPLGIPEIKSSLTPLYHIEIRPY